MNRRRTGLAAGLLSLGLAACGGSSPLAPESPRLVMPEGARFDGGHGFGSGNRAEESTAVTLPVETADGGDSTAERGGYTIGGGN